MNMRFGQHNPAEAVAPTEAPVTQAQAQRVAGIEKARNDLHGAVNAYRVLLNETRLSSAKTQKDTDQQMSVFSRLNEHAGTLNTKNAEEGTMVLSITALNSILLLRDEVNNLKFQNLMLHKKIAKLEEVAAKAPAELEEGR